MCPCDEVLGMFSQSDAPPLQFSDGIGLLAGLQTFDCRTLTRLIVGSSPTIVTDADCLGLDRPNALLVSVANAQKNRAAHMPVRWRKTPPRSRIPFSATQRLCVASATCLVTRRGLRRLRATADSRSVSVSKFSSFPARASLILHRRRHHISVEWLFAHGHVT
jgi:hypothetical protein